MTSSNELPLILSVLVSEQPPSNAMPLGMARELGSAIDVPVVNTDVAIIVTAYCDLNPTAIVSVSYDSDVYRTAMVEVFSGGEYSKLTGTSKAALIESSNLLGAGLSVNSEQSKLVSSDISAQFEPTNLLTTKSSVLFEQSKIVGTSNQFYNKYLTLVGNSAQVKTETAHLIGQSQWYSAEAMLLRAISRVISSESARFIADKLETFSDSALLATQSKRVLTEFARLPFSILRYLAPPLTQTVILKEQVIDGWECGSGALHHYVYHDELPLPMHRLISDRDANSLAMPLSSPRGVLKLSADDANALPNYPCKRKTLGVNPTLDVTLCQPKVFGKASGITVNAQTMLDPKAWLELLISEQTNPSSSGVIFVTNSVLLTRTDSGDSVRLLSFDVGIDNNSYCWTFSASVPFTELSKVDITAEPLIEVDLTVNGQLWRFILDACDDSAQFNSNSLTIRGKSRAILLSQPFAQPRSHKYTSARTARQIANDELNRASVPSGFELDWQLIGANGWSVPANTYSYTNKTAINSLQAIAEAAGGFINAHPSDDVIKFLSNYPLPSWEWAAQSPGVTIDHSLITSRSRNRIQKPKYDGVIVSGQYDGSISARVRRSGTAGAYQPPMITNDLITDSAVARHRGECVLSDTGDIGNIGLSMPLHSDIGLLTPSTLIRVNDGESWIGMVRGTSISGRLANNASLQIEQSIDVERHFDKG